MKRALQKTGPENTRVRTATFPRPPLSGDKDCLSETLYRRFGSRGALDATPWEERAFVFGGLSMPSASQVDVVLGFAERFDLGFLTEFDYWRTPINVSVAVLAMRGLSIPAKQQILRIFEGERPSADSPIVVVHALKNSIAVRYARERIGGMETSGRARIEEWELGIEAAQGQSGRDFYETVLREICRRMEKLPQEQEALHVLALDELTAYSVVEASRGRLQPIFPITWLKNAQKYRVRREAPKHRIGFAISKRQTGLSNGIIEFLNQMLAVEPETTSTTFAMAAIETLKMVRQSFDEIEDLGFFTDELVAVAKADYRAIYRGAIRWRAALLYTRHLFSIDEVSLQTRARTDNWYRIMERTREIFDVELAKLPFELKELGQPTGNAMSMLSGLVLSAFLLEGEDFEIEDRGLEFLLECFELSAEQKTQLIEICSRRSAMSFVLIRLQSWLSNKPVHLEIEREIEIWETALMPEGGKYPTQARVTGEMLRSLQLMYERIPVDGFAAVKRIEYDLREGLRSFCRDNGGFASLAYLKTSVLEEESRVYIGMMCVERPSWLAQGDYSILEFRYLWVDPLFRHRGVARLLLEKTLDHIKKIKKENQPVTKVFLELLPSLAEAKMEFLSVGFRYVSTEEAKEKLPGFNETEGRLTLLLDFENKNDQDLYQVSKQLGSYKFPKWRR